MFYVPDKSRTSGCRSRCQDLLGDQQSIPCFAAIHSRLGFRESKPVSPIPAIPSSSAAFVYDRLALAMRFLAPNETLSPLQTVSIAIRAIVDAAYNAEAAGTSLTALAPKPAAVIFQMLHESAPRIINAADGKILPERVSYLVGVTSGLVSFDDDPFRADRVDYASLLADELSQIHHSRALEERGYPMLRALRIELAWSKPRDPDAPLN